MPRIHCHYLDCVFLDGKFCSAAAIEIDPDIGCKTYRPDGDMELSDWDDEDDLDDWDEMDEEDDDSLWMDEEEDMIDLEFSDSEDDY